MSKKIALLLGSLLLAGTFSLPAAARVNVDVNLGVPFVQVAPPVPQYEVVPGPREGYVWAPGYWAWHDGRHIWIRGRWIGERPGYLWVGERWESGPRGHYFVAGHWDRRPGWHEERREHHDNRDHDRR
jgi:hypothetical protein